MKLSIIIPVYNERSLVRFVIENVKLAIIGQGLDAEIIVIDDGSTDGSREIIENTPNIRWASSLLNSGKGDAVKTGFAMARGEIFLIQDCDHEYDPMDYATMLYPFEEGARVVIGFRAIDESPYILHHFGNWLIKSLTNFLYRANLIDVEACYKAFRRDVIEFIHVESNGFEYDNELICKILKIGYKIDQVPIRYYPREYRDGKKITWRNGVKILWTIVKYRFVE